MSPRDTMEDENCTKECALFHVKQRASIVRTFVCLLPRVGFGVWERLENGMRERGNGFDVAWL